MKIHCIRALEKNCFLVLEEKKRSSPVRVFFQDSLFCQEFMNEFAVVRFLHPVNQQNGSWIPNVSVIHDPFSFTHSQG